MTTVDYFRFPVFEDREPSLFDLSEVSFESQQLPITSHDDHVVHAVFDPDVIRRPTQVSGIKEAIATNRHMFSYLAPLGMTDMVSRVHEAADIGFVSLTLHPYLQEIGAERLDAAIAAIMAAKEKRMIINICTAYGSSKIYRYSPLEVALAICENAPGTPIVFVHGGGRHVLDAMLIAQSFPNVHLDTSFSLPFWMGSSVEQDFAYAIRRLGASRWMYGSDTPFGAGVSSHAIHLDFLERHGFSAPESEALMGRTAAELLRL